MIKQHDSDTVCLYSLGMHMTPEAPARSRMKRSAEQAAGSAVPIPPRAAPQPPRCRSVLLCGYQRWSLEQAGCRRCTRGHGRGDRSPPCPTAAALHLPQPPQGTSHPPRCSFAAGLCDAQACLRSWSCLPCSRGNVLLLKLSSYSLLLSPSLV